MTRVDRLVFVAVAGPISLYDIVDQPAIATVREANPNTESGATVSDIVAEHRHALGFEESHHIRIAANGTFLRHHATCLVSVFSDI